MTMIGPRGGIAGQMADGVVSRGRGVVIEEEVHAAGTGQRL